MEDSYKHQGLRRKLVSTLRKKGITDEKILSAIGKVPRHFFLDEAFLKFAYDDQAFKIGAGQTISQPYTVAVQTSLLEINKGERVLEIGTGSGYQAAILMELGAKVFTIERHRSLYLSAKQLLSEMGYTPKCFYGDGYQGLPAFAPFDKIIVTAAAPYIPPALKEQLKTGGHIVIPVDEGAAQTMYKITKMGNTDFKTEDYGTFRFVPLLQNREI